MVIIYFQNHHNINLNILKIVTQLFYFSQFLSDDYSYGSVQFNPSFTPVVLKFHKNMFCLPLRRQNAAWGLLIAYMSVSILLLPPHHTGEVPRNHQPLSTAIRDTSLPLHGKTGLPILGWKEAVGWNGLRCGSCVHAWICYQLCCFLSVKSWQNHLNSLRLDFSKPSKLVCK